MRVRLSMIVLLMLPALAFHAAAETICSGTVTGPMGRALPAAHVTLQTPDRAANLVTVAVSPGGAYSVVVPREGLWVLRFTGVGYADQSVVLSVPDANPITVSVMLGAYRYNAGKVAPAVNGDFNLWNILNAVSMKKQKDGSYVATVPSKKDSVTFRIRGIRQAESAEGVRGARFVMNREGGYDARVKAVNGKATIVLDMGQLDRSGAHSRVDFPNGTPQTRNVAEAARVWWEGEAAYASGQLTKLFKGKSTGEEPPKWPEFAATLLKKQRQEKDPLVRSVWSLAYVSTGLRLKHKDIPALTSCLEAIAPESPVWAIHPNVMSYAVRNSSWPKERQRAYIESAMNNNPERSARVGVIFNEFIIAYQADDNSGAMPYYDLLMGEYADTPQGQMVAKQYQRPDEPHGKK
jgi:hypothetical protein